MERDQNQPVSQGMSGSASSGEFGAQSSSGSLTEQAKHAVSNVANQATERASERVESGLAQGKDRTARALGAVAQSLRAFGNELRSQNEQGISRFADRAADRADRLANRLNNADPHALVDDIENFARREPAMFIGGAIAVGLLAARFLKSSRRADGRQQMTAQSAPRTSPMVPAERDVTDSLRVRDDMPVRGPNGQPIL
jgi:ElaB/YqjD/DUF883 family membrane-anchored ribosome-binding protein